MTRAAAQRLQLTTELRRLREEAGLTQQQVADGMDWSLSKTVRLEAGKARVRLADVQAMLRLFQVTDQRVIDDLSTLARDSKDLPFTEYKGVVPDAALQFFQLEAGAGIIREVNLNVVPGLLQTDDYVRALLRAHDMTSDIAERVIESRRDRRQLFDRPLPPELFVIIDESVLRRMIGGPEVMSAQIAHLFEMSKQPRISIQVLPFSLGAHAALAGSFIHLEFAEDTARETIFVEDGLENAISQNEPEITDRYRLRFQRLEKDAVALEQVDRLTLA